jgi:predicted CXXCH cytochrome family protein
MGAKRLLALCAAAAAVSLFIVAMPDLSTTVVAAPPEVGTNPHGAYGSDTRSCELCHDPHDAQGPKLNVFTSERETCYLCHDGGVATTDIRTEFGETELGISTRVSSHPVAAERDGIRLACSDCHAPHQDPAQVTQLLAVRDGETVLYSSPGNPIGNAFCYACHGATSELPGAFGDHTGFETSAHGTDADVAAPNADNGIRCLACHEAHAADHRLLTTGDQEELCYSCHSLTTPNTSGGSNPEQAFTATPNDTSVADGDPIRIYHHPIAQGEQDGASRLAECASCHNPHLADASSAGADSKLADPTDTRSPFEVSWLDEDMNRGNIALFCTKCHVSPDATSPIPSGPGVPYAIRLVDDAASDADGTPHDQFSQAGWETAAHTNLACTACHDPHGSSNAWMLRETVVGLDGSTSSTMTGFGALASDDWGAFEAMCVTCHADGLGPTHPAIVEGELCTTCHSHGDGL